MAKIAICNEIFGNLPFNKICKKVSDYGYTGIELAPFTFSEDIRKLSHQQVNQIRNDAEANNLQITACHWLLVSPSGMHITTPDRKIFNKTNIFFKSMVDFANTLEATYLVFGSPKQRSIEQSWDFNEAYQQGVSFFQEMGDYAKENDVIIALEPLGPSITNYMDTTKNTLKIAELVNNSNVKIHLDVAAMMRDPLPIVQQIKLVGKSMLAYVHVNDPNLLGPGMGDVDYGPLIEAFEEIDYQGWYSVETFNEDYSAEEIAKKSIDYMKNYLH
jgi:sugar phosphate isomerase/epimerase